MMSEEIQSDDYSVPIQSRRVPPDFAGLRLDQALARMFPEHSRSRLQQWLRDGHIQLNAGAAKPKQKIWGGEEIEIRAQPTPSETAFRPEAIELDVIHEDESVLVVNKPAGLVVHPGTGNWQGTMLNALLQHAPQVQNIPRAGIVHRLDKETSGLLVVAKTLEAQTSLVRQLQARTVSRQYLALVHGAVAADGEVSGAIGRDPRDRVRMAVVAGGKPALTRYRVLTRYNAATLLECSLETGRTHQIRVHMQSIQHPLVGDPLYRRARPSGREPLLEAFPRQALHATRLAFVHPSTEQTVRFEVPPPEDMLALLAELV
jgi:23S rRNA pseudouridine1911/1915/1917 synthase